MSNNISKFREIICGSVVFRSSFLFRYYNQEKKSQRTNTKTSTLYVSTWALLFAALFLKVHEIFGKQSTCSSSIQSKKATELQTILRVKPSKKTANDFQVVESSLVSVLLTIILQSMLQFKISFSCIRK